MPDDSEEERSPELEDSERQDALPAEPGEPIAPAPEAQDQLRPGAGRPIEPAPSSVGPPIPDSVVNRMAGIGGLFLVVGAGVLFLIVLGVLIWLVVTHL